MAPVPGFGSPVPYIYSQDGRTDAALTLNGGGSTFVQRIDWANPATSVTLSGEDAGYFRIEGVLDSWGGYQLVDESGNWLPDAGLHFAAWPATPYELNYGETPGFQVTITVANYHGSDSQNLSITLNDPAGPQLNFGPTGWPVSVHDWSGVVHVYTRESTGAGYDTSLVVVSAVAPTDYSAVFSYSISGGADAALFTIDPDTGLLSFVGAPDFEAPQDADGDNRYEVDVLARAQGDADVPHVSRNLLIHVEDVGNFINVDYDGMAHSTTGTDENDYIYGNDQADTMWGGLAGDGLYGQDGDDSLDGAEGDDFVGGGAGDDSLRGGEGNDRLDGSDGNDSADGGIGNDVAIGGSGNDALQGGDDADLLIGDGGYNYSDQKAMIVDGDGASSYYEPTSDDDDLDGGTGDDTLVGSRGNDTLQGGEGHDELHGDGTGVYFSGAGGGDGGGFYGGYYGQSFYSGDADDGTDDDSLDGGAGNDTINGGRGSDTLLGGEGDDYLLGGDIAPPPPPPDDLPFALAEVPVPDLDGDDTLEGGAGWDRIDGGDGIDTARYSGNRADYLIQQGKGDDVLVEDRREDSPDGFDILRNVEVLEFADGAVRVADILGGNTDPTITSNGGGDTAATSVLENSTQVTTLIANDAETPAGNLSYAIVGGADAGLFELRNGNELHFVDAPDFENLPLDMGAPGYEVIVEVADGDGGIDQQTLTVTVDNVSGLFLTGGDGKKALVGTGEEDTLIGGAGNSKLEGGDGNDYIDGGTGRDTMTGGQGDDTYVVDAKSERVIESAGGGHDLVLTTMQINNLADNLEDMVFIGTGGFKAVGNALSNLLVGGADMDSLHGGAGDDTLVGGAGNDRCNGEAGDDTLVGGAGDDRYTGGAGADVFVIGEGLDAIADFSVADDTLQLDLGMFANAKLGAGNTLADSDLFVGKLSAAKGGQHFILDATKLYYDADGAGAGAAAVQIAQLSGKPAITGADFIFTDPILP